MNSTSDVVPSAPLSSNDRLWSVLCHLSSFFGFAILFPLTVYLVMRKDSPHVAEQARESLNFHLSLLIYGIVSAILIMIFVGVLMLAALAIFSIVCSIIGAIKASEGIVFRYPLCIRFVS